MVNRVGPTFVHRLTEMTGAKPSQIVRAYLATREVFCFGTLWKQIEALDNRVDDAVQAAMINHLRGLSIRATTWFLHPRRLAEAMQPLIERLTPAVAMLRARLEPAAAASPQVAEWVAAGVPAALAQAVAATEGLFDALDIAEIAESHQAGAGRDRRPAPPTGRAPGAATAAPADRGAAGRQLLGDAGQDRARRRAGGGCSAASRWRC